MPSFRIHVATEICKGCGLCSSLCPKSVLRLSDRRNERGHTIVEADRPDECVGCLVCQFNCPDFAIYVEESKGAGETTRGTGLHAREVRS